MPGLLESLTRSEQLWVWRRHKKLTQREAAAKFDVSPTMWMRWERGETGNWAPPPQIGCPQPRTFEELTILRKRYRWTQKELADKMGCSQVWVHHMEAGEWATERLMAFWAPYLAEARS